MYHKQWLRKKPIWYNQYPVKLWLGLLIGVIVLVWLLFATALPFHLETRV